jgi:glycosyltransferase involved in cell wall biosynthesis
MAGVCLNMIVKNEAHVIERCLRSMRPLIDGWCIVDTGSSDGTQALIRELYADLPGQLHERPWRDFASNRSEAIQLAGRDWDYLFFIDADEELTLPAGWIRPELTAAAYGIQYRNGPLRYQRPSLVSNRLPWRYVGVLHEYLDCGQPVLTVPLPGPAIICRPEGARSQDPLKYERDVALLREGLAAEPGNLRYRFYLAQSLRDAGHLEEAIENYRLRAEAGGWAEEVYIARLQIGRLLELQKAPPPAVQRALLEAHLARPSRHEALVDLARHYRERQEYPAAYLFARAAAELPPSGDTLFVEPDAETWRGLDEWSIAAYWTGRHRESFDLCEQLLKNGDLPESQRARVGNNLAFAVAALGSKEAQK